MSLASESPFVSQALMALNQNDIEVLHHCQLPWVSTVFTQPLLTARTHYRLDF